MPREVIVTDGDTEQTAFLLEGSKNRFKHRGDTFGRVRITETGEEHVVEIPENPRTPDEKHVWMCEDCGREPRPASDEEGPLKKENVCHSRSNAELLRDIHAAKTGHSPHVETRA